jgi:acetylornithine deacetylase/succinyl-diaminopimelate desuccinylase-like protein
VGVYGVSEAQWRELRTEVVDLLTTLLRIDTTNPPGNETACALALRDYFAANGLKAELVGELPDRQNVVVRLEGSPGPTLLLTGHMDTVPTELAEWSVPPFDGVVKDGFIWGPGTMDMKNQVAAEAVAVARLARSGAALSGTLVFAATADEEVGEHCGLLWLCRERPELIRSDFSLNEGMGGYWLSVDDKHVFLLSVGEKAFAQFRITVHGRGGHGSVPEKERSAVIDLAKAVEALGLYDPPAIISPSTAEFIDRVVGDRALGARLKDPVTARAAAVELRAADLDVASLVEPLLGATFTPTMLHAGTVVNVIPTHAEADVDCRIIPEMTLEETRAIVTAALDPLGIDWEFAWIDTTEANASTAPTRLSDSIARVIGRDFPDAELAAGWTSGFTDSRWLREYFPDCVAYGFAPYPSQCMQAMNDRTEHAPDERILVEDVTYQALFFERLARDLLASGGGSSPG